MTNFSNCVASYMERDKIKLLLVGSKMMCCIQIKDKGVKITPFSAKYHLKVILF